MEIPPMPPIKLGGSPPPPPVILELHFPQTTIESPLLDWIKRSVRTRGGPPEIPVTTDEPRWVIVKGMSDSDTINGVYGTYTEEQAGWLLQEFASDSYARWTKIQLSAGPQ